jgi:hypothetical protein
VRPRFLDHMETIAATIDRRGHLARERGQGEEKDVCDEYIYLEREYERKNGCEEREREREREREIDR